MKRKLVGIDMIIWIPYVIMKYDSDNHKIDIKYKFFYLHQKLQSSNVNFELKKGIHFDELAKKKKRSKYDVFYPLFWATFAATLCWYETNSRVVII